MTFTVYALVDPETHVVRYVGQTTNVPLRYRQHCSARDSTTKHWIKGLANPPFLVVLEQGECARVPVPGSPGKFTGKGTICETKWLKRFRRTILNRRLRENSSGTWDRLVNPPHDV